jgi:hypothetical protein
MIIRGFGVDSVASLWKVDCNIEVGLGLTDLKSALYRKVDLVQDMINLATYRATSYVKSDSCSVPKSPPIYPIRNNKSDQIRSHIMVLIASPNRKMKNSKE